MTSLGSFFGSFPHIWLVHLAIITSIVTKQCRLVETHQSHWCWYVCLMMIITFFPPFVSLYWGNKETQNHMLVCQALITDRCWGTLFWGIPLHLRVFLFYSLLLFWSVIYFSSSFILSLASVHNFSTEADIYGTGYPCILSSRDAFFFFVD